MGFIEEIELVWELSRDNNFPFSIPTKRRKRKIHLFITQSWRAEESMMRNSSGKGMPWAAAAWGRRLVAVMPGMVLISSTTGEPVSGAMKSNLSNESIHNPGRKSPTSNDFSIEGVGIV